jgi:hypothetical protein
MLADVYSLEIISNFYITFYTNNVNYMKNKKHHIDISNTQSVYNILPAINNNEPINIIYSSESIDTFTHFLSLFLKEELHIVSYVDRLNMCIVNEIIINPLKI